MNVEAIRERLKDRFRPSFEVVTSSGNQYPVPHPDFIFLTSRTVVVANKKGDVVVLDPLQVVGFGEIPRRNGKPKRRQQR